MTVKAGFDYCGEHQPESEQTQDDIFNDYLRITCPLDNKHTCYANNLDKHLKKCNAKLDTSLPYILKNINTDNAADLNLQTTRQLSSVPVGKLLEVINKVDKLYTDYVENVIKKQILRHEILAGEINKPEYGATTRKHLVQTSSLLGLLQESNLLLPNTCYVEFGAGKGQLSYWLSKVTNTIPNTAVLLVERASLRHKLDNKLDKSENNVHRIRADIADLVLSEVGIIKQAKHIVGVTKHLCGGATDLALRCAMNSREITNIAGLVMAFCCHHRCQWSIYTGKQFFEKNNITSEDFDIICGLVSWATCGTGQSRETRQKIENNKDTEAENDAIKIARNRDAEIALSREQREIVASANELNDTIYNNNGTEFNSLTSSLMDLSNNTVVISDEQSGFLHTEPNILQDVNVQNESIPERSKIIAQREVVHTPQSDVKYSEDVQLFLPPDLSLILDALENLQDEICKEHVFLTLQALNRREKWAMQMLDASAKFPQGVLIGSYYQMGNFDECISVRLHERDHDVPRIKGQYCLADVQPNEILLSNKNKEAKLPRTEQNSTLHWAICVPHSCKPKEISAILNFILNGVIGSSDAVSVNVTQRKCHFDHDVPYTTAEMVYGYIIVAFLSLICIATFSHVLMYYHRKNDKMPANILTEIMLSLSVIRNTSKLLTINNSSDLNLKCICGIKFLSMILIIAAHSLLFLTGGPIVNEGFLKEATQKTENGIFLNNPLLVDTYLLISGFLMCRLLLLELKKREGKVNFIFLYICRYVRLTPAYLVVIGLYCTWLARLDTGPLWESRILTEQDRCLNSWWANILYINNYVNVDNMCMFQSWYLSVDTQLFMLAPLIIYPLWRWNILGVTLLVLSTVIACIVPFVITYRDHLDPTLMMYIPELQDLSTNWYFVNVYIKTHMRASSYCFGLIFGYLVHKIQSSDYKFSKISVSLGWIFGMVFLSAAMFSVTVFYNPDYNYGSLEAATYSVLHRVLWCLGVGWVILACVTDNAGPVTKFLCWKPFIPLSRLTYCAYLVNGLVELHSFGTIRQPRFMSIYHLACDVVAHLVLTFTLAFILCIIFESPIHGFERILFGTDKRRKQNEDTRET
ncbi:uncharacterized protein CBL_04762 [Carabus blaptoides fortunei]